MNIFSSQELKALDTRLRPRHRTRVCHYPGCDTILSIYNKNKYCHAHQFIVEDMKWEKMCNRKHWQNKERGGEG